MKKKFIFSPSNFIILLVILFFIISLTGYMFRPETSKLGSSSLKQGQNVVYVKDLNLSVSISPKLGGYFSDTKRKSVADLMKDRNLIYIAGDEDGESEFHIRKYDIESFDENTWEDYYRNYSELFNIYEYENAGIIEIDGQPYLHYFAAREDTGFHEYDVISGYVGVSRGKVFSIELMNLYSREKSILDDRDSLNSESYSIIESITFGEVKISSVSKGIFLYSFSLLVFLIIVLFIWFSNYSYAADYGIWSDNLEQKHTKDVLGVFSICIVLHHLVQHVGQYNAGLMGFMEYMGVCFVGVFFFYSGYGLLKSFHSKDNYLSGFFKKRLPAVLVPAIFINLIFVLRECITGNIEGAGDFALKFFGVKLLNGQMWYIIEILVLYTAFWVCFKFIKNEKKALLTMGLFTVLMILGSLMLGHGQYWFQGEWWYNSTLLFWLGMVFERHGEKITNLIKCHYKKSATLIIILFVTFFELNKFVLTKIGYWTEYAADATGVCDIDKLITLSVQLPMIIFFVALIYIVGLKVRTGNKVTAFLGAISLELYLVHNFFIVSFSFVGGAGILFAMVLISSIIAAMVIHNICAVIIAKITKQKVKGIVKVKITLPKIKKRDIKNLLKPGKIKKGFRITFRQFICITLTLLSLYPVYEMVIYGTKRQPVSGVMLMPGGFFLENLNGINWYFESIGGGLYKGIINSCIVAFPSALLATYLGAMTAYAIEKYKFKGREFFGKSIIGFMLVPSYAGFAGYYALVVKLGLLNNFIPVIMPAAATPAAVYFIRMYLKNFQFQEITEAARIDGAGEYKIFNRIIIPMLSPVLALQLTFSFMASWNNGYAQTLILYKLKYKTASSYVSMMGTGKSASTDPEVFTVLTAVSIVPVLIYIICSKYIVNSITLGAVKE